MKNRFLPAAILCYCVSFTCVSESQAEDDWTRFRGSDGQGVAASSTLGDLSDIDNAIAWKTPIFGQGWSSPVVSNGQIWLTTAVAEAASKEYQQRKLAGDPMKGIKEVAAAVELHALCIDLETGGVQRDVLLRKVEEPDPINPLNSYASPTPVIESGRVYCHFGTYGTWCLDAKTGATIWNRTIPLDHSVGPGSSPIVEAGKIVLVCDGIDKQFVTALDQNTGETLWSTARPEMRAGNVEFKKAYSTPITINVAGTTQVIAPGAQWICGYDLNDGREIWRIDHGDGFSTSPSPIVAGGLILFSTGYMRPDLVAVRPNGTGDVTDTHVAWRVSRGVPTMPSPVATGNKIFMVSDGGVLTQISATDGSITWQERLGGKFCASPIAVDGKVIFCSQNGELTIIKDGDEFQELSKHDMPDRLMASPAVAGNDLIVRTEKSLLRIRGQ